MLRRLGWAMLPNRVRLNLAQRSHRVNRVIIQDNWKANGEPNYSGHADIDYILAYERQPYLFAAVSAIAEDIAALPVQITFAGEVVPRDEWPSLFRIFDQANRDESFADLTRALIVDQILMGEFFALMEAGALYWVPAWRTRPIPDKTKRIAGYVTEVNGQRTIFGRDEMIYLPDHGPRYMVEGMSRIDPLTYTLRKDGKQIAYELSLWDNNGRLAGVLETEERLTPDQIRELGEMWATNYGGTRGTGKTAVLSSGLKYTRIGVTAEEAGYHQSRKENVDEILAVLGVPPTRVMRTDNVNYANSVSELGTYYRNTVRPRADRFFAAFTRVLMRGTQWKIQADYSNIHYLVLERKELFTMALGAMQGGLLTPNEARELVGYPAGDRPEDDERIVPQQQPAFAPLAIAPPAQLPAPEPKEIEQEDRAVDDEAVLIRSFREKAERQKRILDREFKIARDELALPVLEAMEKANDQALLDDLRGRGKRPPNPHDPPKLPEAADFEESNGKLVRDYVLGAWRRVGQEEMDALKAQRSLMLRDRVSQHMGDFDLQDPEVLVELGLREVEFKTLTEDIQRRVAELIASGLERGLSINQIRQELGAFFAELKDWQATRIARTESAIATNKAAHTAMKQVGATKKRWLHSGNPNGRPSHIANASQGDIKFDSPFSNGMMHPGDTRAPAEEIINCQCALVATGF